MNSLDTHIIEAITSIRNNKKRPDEQSIFEYLKSHINDYDLHRDIVEDRINDLTTQKVILNRINNKKNSYFINENSSNVNKIFDSQNTGLTQCLFDEALMSPKLVPPTPSSAEKLINDTYEKLNRSKIETNLGNESFPVNIDDNIQHTDCSKHFQILQNKINDLEIELNEIKTNQKVLKEIKQSELVNILLQENNNKNELLKILAQNNNNNNKFLQPPILGMAGQGKILPVMRPIH